MITYYNEKEFEEVVTNKIVTAITDLKANTERELSCVYINNSPVIEYAIRGKAILKTSYNNNGYFIIEPKK